MAPTVFISYARRDFPFARAVHNELIKHDVEVWIDLKDIHPGAQWNTETISAIQHCRIFVILLSRYSVVSETVKAELIEARRSGRLVIPLLMESAGMKGEFTVSQWIDGRVNFGECIALLLQATEVSSNSVQWSKVTVPPKRGFLSIPDLYAPHAVRLLLSLLLIDIWLITFFIAVALIVGLRIIPIAPPAQLFSIESVIIEAWWMVLGVWHIWIFAAVYRRAVSFGKLLLHLTITYGLVWVFLVGGIQYMGWNAPGFINIDAVLLLLVAVGLLQFAILVAPGIHRYLPAWSDRYF